MSLESPQPGREGLQKQVWSQLTWLPPQGAFLALLSRTWTKSSLIDPLPLSQWGPVSVILANGVVSPRWSHTHGGSSAFVLRRSWPFHCLWRHPPLLWNPCPRPAACSSAAKQNSICLERCFPLVIYFPSVYESKTSEGMIRASELPQIIRETNSCKILEISCCINCCHLGEHSNSTTTYPSKSCWV